MMSVDYFLYGDIDHRFGYQGHIGVLVDIELQLRFFHITGRQTIFPVTDWCSF